MTDITADNISAKRLWIGGIGIEKRTPTSLPNLLGLNDKTRMYTFEVDPLQTQIALKILRLLQQNKSKPDRSWFSMMRAEWSKVGRHMISALQESSLVPVISSQAWAFSSASGRVFAAFIAALASLASSRLATCALCFLAELPLKFSQNLQQYFRQFSWSDS